jgi:hypothetical protein
MRAKQEPGPAYHRRSDLKRLKEHALDTPLIVSDNGRAYEVRVVTDGPLLIAGRHEVVFSYVQGFKDACDLNGKLGS